MLDDAARLAREYVDSLPTRPVGAQAGLDELRSRLARPLTDDGEDPRVVIEDLARDVDPGLVASAGPRYFGFVIGGVAARRGRGGLADLGLGPERRRIRRVSPALSVAEEVAARLGARAARPAARLRRSASSPAARWRTSPAWRRRATRCCATPGWDVEADGPAGRAGGARDRRRPGARDRRSVACRMLGLGAERVRIVPTRRPGPHAAPSARGRARASRTARRSSARRRARSTPGAFDPLARDRRRLPRARGVVPRRRRVRAVGGRQPDAPRPDRGLRAAPTRGPPTGTSG